MHVHSLHFILPTHTQSFTPLAKRTKQWLMKYPLQAKSSVVTAQYSLQHHKSWKDVFYKKSYSENWGRGEHFKSKKTVGIHDFQLQWKKVKLHVQLLYTYTISNKLNDIIIIISLCTLVTIEQHIATSWRRLSHLPFTVYTFQQGKGREVLCTVIKGSSWSTSDRCSCRWFRLGQLLGCRKA